MRSHARRRPVRRRDRRHLGGLVGTLRWIADPSVNYVATAPGPFGDAVAFAAEATISFVLMLVVLSVSNQQRLSPFTGAVVAVLVAAFITVRSAVLGDEHESSPHAGPDVIGGIWRSLWIYFAAPPLGMLMAAEIFVRVRGRLAVRCASSIATASVHFRGYS